MTTDADIWTPGGEQGPAGPAGPEGPAGPPIELRTNDTHVQWRVEGDVTWIDLEPLANLIGPAGPTGPQGSRGVAGDSGDNIELQTSATHIQWRVVGDATWINLVALADLQGDPGESSTILRDTGAPDDALDGSDGDYYIREDEPDIGVVLYGPKTAGVWGGSFVVLTGPEGPASDKVVLNGSGAPIDSVGTNGDFYIDTDVWDIYGPKADGSWPAAVSLIGPASELDELTDVDLTTVAPTTGDILVFDGVDWVPGKDPYKQYGELDITVNTTPISITAAVTPDLTDNSDYIQVTGIWDAVPHGLTEGITQQTNSLTIARTGVHRINIWASVGSDSNNTRIALKFAINGVITLGRRPLTHITTAGDRRAIAAFGFHEFTAGDVITLWFASTVSADVTFFDAVFALDEFR